LTRKDKANRDLGDYLHARLQHLEHCNAEIEEKLCDERMSLCKKIDEGVYSKHDHAIGRIAYHLEMVLGNTFRYTLLVGVCSFLEEAIKAISRRLVPDYDNQLRDEKRGNWLNKHVRMLRREAALDPVPIQADLQTFDDLIMLRNCIVHSWGNVSEARNPTAVRASMARIALVELSRDGYLYLGDEVISTAIIAAENIAEHMLTSKLQLSMT
jgi:hypothetical protein